MKTSKKEIKVEKVETPVEVMCFECSGTGRNLPEKTCPTCNGTGK